MNLKKKKRFTPKNEDSFLMSLFLSSCFSFQTRTDLVLVKFFFSFQTRADLVLVNFIYNAAVQRLLKILENLKGNDCDGNHF